MTRCRHGNTDQMQRQWFGPDLHTCPKCMNAEGAKYVLAMLDGKGQQSSESSVGDRR